MNCTLEPCSRRTQDEPERRRPQPRSETPVAVGVNWHFSLLQKPCFAVQHSSSEDPSKAYSGPNEKIIQIQLCVI